MADISDERKFAVIAHYLSQIKNDIEDGISPDLLESYLASRFPLYEYLCPDSQARKAVIGNLRDSVSIPDPTADSESWIQTHANSVFAQIPFELLHEVYVSTRDDVLAQKLSLALTAEDIDLEACRSLSKAYEAAIREHWDETVSKQRFVDCFAACLGEKMTNTNPPKFARNPLATQCISDFQVLPNRKMKIAVVALRADVEVLAQLDSLEEFVARSRADLVVLHAVKPSDNADMLREALAPNFHESDVVMLTSSDLKKLSVARSFVGTFREIVLQHMPLNRISPFQFNGPVSADSFFGRHQELRQIYEGVKTNYSVCGPRQIGKTSLLQAVLRKANTDDKSSSTSVLYADLSTCQTLEQLRWQLLSLFTDHLGDEEIAALSEAASSTSTQLFFDKLLSTLRIKSKRFLLLLDEVDDLLASRSVDQFERMVRALSNGGQARFVIAGYRKLKERTTDRTTHLYNLVDPIWLGPMNDHEARELVTSLMGSIRVEFASATTIDDILKSGSTVPWILQYFCNLLVERLHRDNRREVLDEDIAAVAESDQFVTRLCQVIENSDMPLLEQLVVYLCVYHNGHRIEEATLRSLMKTYLYSAVPFRELRRALNNLVDTYVLHRENAKYWFYVPQLKSAIRSREGGRQQVEEVIRYFADEYREAYA